jgi:hypothetical protein
MLIAIVSAIVGAVAITMHGGNYKFPGSRIVPWGIVAGAAYALSGALDTVLALLVFGGLRLGEHGPFLVMNAWPRPRAAVSEWGKLFEPIEDDALAFWAIKSVQSIPAAAFAWWLTGSVAGAWGVMIFIAVATFIYWTATHLLQDTASAGKGTALAELCTGLLFGALFIAAW